jgi:molybdate transport system substrate-binding protein
MRTVFALLLALTSIALPATAQQQPPLTVFAAASLRDALTRIAQEYHAEVTFSFAGSGTLARQIAAGAPADAVILAHPDWTDWLQTRGLLQPDTLRDVAGGQLVVVGPAGAEPLAVPPDAVALIAALDGGRLAMGQRDAVPAGAYAREWLQHIGAWDALLPHLAETDNVRAALALVALGAAPMGVVYASDAVAEPRVQVIYAVPSDAHTPIRYPAAAITPAGRDFIALLSTPQAAAIFTQYGLTP